MSRSALLPALLAGLAPLLGCPGGRCSFNGDCPTEMFCNQETRRCETECFSKEDCKNRPGCETSVEGCEALGIVCQEGRCVGEEGVAPEERIGAEDDGWDAPAFTGEMFVIDDLSLGGAGVGFDILGTVGPAIDNRLASLAPFANPAVSSGLRQGYTILLVEIAGLVPDYDGEDYAVTVKFYAGEDVDGRPDNNFGARGGETCCTFRPLGTSTVMGADGTPQAVTRARARISRGLLRGLGTFSVNLQLDLGNDRPETIVIERAKLSLVLPDDLSRIEDGLLGGAVPMRSLGLIDNPYCRTQAPGCPPVSEDGTLLDIVSALTGRADVDVDDDGLECVWDTNGDYELDVCCQGYDDLGRCVQGQSCAVTTIESPDAADPYQCLLRQGFEDGYSASLRLTAVKASLR